MRKIIYTLSFLCVCAQVTAQNAAWRNLYIPNIPISTPIWDIVFDKDTNFYVTTDTSLFRYNGGVWSKLIPPISANEKLRYLAIDNQGGLWVSVLDSGVLRYYNNTWKKYNSSNSAFVTDKVIYMKNDSLSKFMVIGTSYGVFTFNSTTNTLANLGVPTDYTVNYFDTENVAISKTGDWYFGPSHSYVYIYKPQTGMWRSILPNYYHNLKIGFDLNNNLYGMSPSPPISRYDTTTQSWKNLPFVKKQDISGSFDFTTDKKNKMWYFSQENGIMRFDSLNSTKYTMSNSPLYSNSINRIIVSTNNLKYIVGQGGGIQILDDALLISTKDQDFARSKLITSYNNPTQERLTLQLDKNLSINQLTIQVHDLNGRLINQNMYDVKQNCVELNMVALTSGIYFVTCLDLNTQRKETIKIVK